MKFVTFDRMETVQYVVGVSEDGALARALKGKTMKLTHMSMKDVVYVERVGQAPLHRGDLTTKQRDHAKRRAKELEQMNLDDWEVKRRGA